MLTHLDQPRCIAAMEEQFQALDDLLASLDPDDWHRPTALPGWDVQANVAHIIGTEAMMLGEPGPSVDVDVSALAHVRNDLGAFNEGWVISLAGATPEEMLDAYRERVGKRREVLSALDEEAWAAETSTPGGPDSYGRFIRIRIMDCWMHEQDIREAIGRPGHESGSAVDHTLDEMQAVMGYVLAKKVGVPSGSSVTFDLTGAAGRTIHVAVDGRAAVVEELPGPATVTIRLPAVTFTRIGGGRSSDTTGVIYEGDEALGRQVIDNLAYMI